MAKKYCDQCSSPVEMTELSCRTCGCTSFVHSRPTEDLCDCAIPLINEGNCDRCKKKIGATRLQFLESKPSKVGNSATTKQVSARIDQEISSRNLTSEKTIDDLIRAQNRTTHAVRAFVRFLFIQLSGFTLAIFLWNLSTAFIDEQQCVQYGTNCTGNSFFQFTAAIVLIGSVIWSSQAGWEELGKSEVR